MLLWRGDFQGVASWRFREVMSSAVALHCCLNFLAERSTPRNIEDIQLSPKLKRCRHALTNASGRPHSRPLVDVRVGENGSDPRRPTRGTPGHLTFGLRGS
jgi:hypothetical protein